MKKKLFIGVLTFLHCFVTAQSVDYNVVFDITSNDPVSQQAVVRQANLIKDSNSNSKLEIVIYGQALDLVIQEKSVQAESIRKLLTHKNVSIKVCAITMKRNKVEAEALLPGIEIVPDGIYEIISKQREGWGYIKVAN